MNFVLTLIAGPDTGSKSGPLGAETIDPAYGAVEAQGAWMGEPVWLAENEALDIPFDYRGDLDDVRLAVDTVCADLPCDHALQITELRRKQVLLADMESTIIENEMLDDLAALAGIGEKVAGITARAMNGEIDFAESLRERVGLLDGLPEVMFEQAWEGVRYVPGGQTLVRTMRANGAHAALVSGGFGLYARRVAEQTGFDEYRANEIETPDGAFNGRVIEPILDKGAKVDALRDITAACGVPREAAITVGDGANDLPMLLAAGTGVAFRAKPSVAELAPFRVDHGDLTGLLYIQGYRKEDFVTG